VDEVVVGNYSNQAEAQMWAELLREPGQAGSLNQQRPARALA